MAGDANNIRVWESGDVYVLDPDVTFSANTHIPDSIDDDLSSDWIPAGLMLGDPGVEMPRSLEQTDVNSWQQGRVLVRYKNGKIDMNFTLLEDNEVTAFLLDSANVPGVRKAHIAVEFVDDDGYKERRISKLPAHLWCPNDNKEQDINGREVQCALRPDNGAIFTVQEGVPAGDGS